jgi:hypothetical protein
VALMGRGLGYNPYLRGLPKDWIGPPSRWREEVLALPFVSVPPGGTANAFACVQTMSFKPKRFCIYADDATKLSVMLHMGCELGGTSQVNALPAAIFSDGPASDRKAFVIHCSECGAPVEQGAARCKYCRAPFTWRITETAHGMAGLALDFPTLSAGIAINALFRSRASVAIGVDAAFIGFAAGA